MQWKIGIRRIAMLNQEDRLTLVDIDNLARRLETQAYDLRCAVEYCKRHETLKGLDEMVAFAFNAQQHQPQYGGGGGGLPVGRYKGVVVDTAQVNVEKAGQVTGGYLALELTPVEGPLAGQKHTDRLNLHNTNPKVVEIANKQLSAYCHVLNQFNLVDTAQLHNIPFWFDIGYQKGEEPSEAKPNGGFTEVKAIFDINGNEPGKAGAGPQVNAGPAPQGPVPGAPAGGVQATGAGWGGAPANPAPAAGQWQQGATPAPAAGNAGWGAR